MPVKTLVDLATKASIKNVASIGSVGYLPLKLVRPILEKVDSAEQLHQIELSSPLLQGEDEEMAELWRALIRKHFPGWEKKNYAPKNPASWHRVYAKYDREQRAAIAQAEAVLRERMGALQKEKEDKVVNIVSDRLLPRLPRATRSTFGVRRTGGADLPSHLGLNAGIRTKMTNGQSVLKRARKEAQEISYRQGLSTPSGSLSIRAGQIKRAPEAMVNDHRVKNQPSIRIKAPAAPKKLAERDDELARREARLLALKKGSSSKPVTVVSDSDDEGDNDLFGAEDETTEAKSMGKVKASTSRHEAVSPPKRATLPATKKTSGLLSNAHRPASEKNIRYATTVSQPGSSPAHSTAPPRAGHSQGKTTTASSPPISRPKHMSRSPSPTRLARAARDTSPPGLEPLVRKRREPVDIFMRPKKQVRR